MVWVAAVRAIGFRIRRSREVYAATDGQGTILIGEASILDADDCLPQLVLHELCHALVEGAESARHPDWGLDNTTGRDQERERAALRLQAALTEPWGLRAALAPTTEFREFYRALPPDPLTPASLAEVVAARRGAVRADRAPFFPHLGRALRATAETAQQMAASEGPAGPSTAHPLRRLATRRPLHPTGFPPRAGAGGCCGECAWFFRGGRGRPVARCRQADGVRVDAGWSACERFESAVSCESCGACCREAYDAVQLGARDRTAHKHPELVFRVGRRRFVAREAGRCAALTQSQRGAYACRVYEDRPQSCRDFARGGSHCLTARRRVGLSR